MTSSLRNVHWRSVACHTLEIRTLDLQSAQYKLTLEDARTLERRTLEGARYLLVQLYIVMRKLTVSVSCREGSERARARMQPACRRGRSTAPTLDALTSHLCFGHYMGAVACAFASASPAIARCRHHSTPGRRWCQTPPSSTSLLSVPGAA